MSDSPLPGTGGEVAVHIGRQPIYDVAGQLHAYELLFRRTATASASHRSEAVFDPAEDDAATTATILAAFSAFDLRELLSARPGFVNLTRAFLVGDLPLPFTPGSAVLEVLETVEVDPEVVAGVRGLVNCGYSVALDDFVYRPGTEPLLEVASIVKVDVLGTPWEESLATARRARSYGARLLAERVEDAPMLDRCVGEGFELFQGYHLGRPETLTAQTLAPAHAMLLRVLAELGDPDVTAASLEASLRRDPALTFRLLKIANSAASGTRRRVRSLRDALVLVGLAKLRSWVVLLAMSGSPQRGALLADALVQAYSCELIAHGTSDVAPDEAFTLGLLDGLGEVLGLTADELASLMPVLAPELGAALAGVPSPLRRVLDAVHAYQRGDVAGVRLARLDVDDVGQAYLRALTFAARVEADVAA